MNWQSSNRKYLGAIDFRLNEAGRHLMMGEARSALHHLQIADTLGLFHENFLRSQGVRNIRDQTITVRRRIIRVYSAISEAYEAISSGGQLA